MKNKFQIILLSILFIFLSSTGNRCPEAVEIENDDFPYKKPYYATLLTNQIQPKSDFFMRKSRTMYMRYKQGETRYHYSYWRNRQSERLAVLIPGLNASCRDSTAAYLAEILFERGYSVVEISSTMHWTFVQSILSAHVPGYIPQDSRDTHQLIARIVADLEKRRDRPYSTKVLIGLSMGGIHTLFLADHEANHPKIGVDQYIAINPVIDFGKTLGNLDRLYTDSLSSLRSLGEEQWNQSLFALKLANLVDPDKKDPISDLLPEEARLIFGLYFKRSLSQFIVMSHDQENMGVLTAENSTSLRKETCYEEAEQYSYYEYVEKFVMNYYQNYAAEPWQEAKTLEEVLEESSLRSIRDTLRENQNIYIVHTKDDPLNDAESMDFLKQVMDEERLFLFSYGGHMGNLSFPKFQELFLELIAKS